MKPLNKAPRTFFNILGFSIAAGAVLLFATQQIEAQVQELDAPQTLHLTATNHPHIFEVSPAYAASAALPVVGGIAIAGKLGSASFILSTWSQVVAQLHRNPKVAATIAIIISGTFASHQGYLKWVHDGFQERIFFSRQHTEAAETSEKDAEDTQHSTPSGSNAAEEKEALSTKDLRDMGFFDFDR